MTVATPIIVVGAGGHAAVVIEALRAEGAFSPVAVVDPAPDAVAVLGVPVVGDDAMLPRLQGEGVTAAVIAIGANALRQRLGERLIQLGFLLPTIVHPSALVSPSAVLGCGVVVMARACIGARAHVGAYAIINTGAIVEHDCEIDAAAHIAPGVALGGCVHVGARTLVGIGSAARPGVRMANDVIIGAGSAVVCDISPSVIVAGIPARRLRRRETPA